MLKMIIKKGILYLYKKGRKYYKEEVYCSFREQYKIHDSFRFNGENILFYGKGQITCGINSYIGSNSTVQAKTGYKVIIGNNCSISHNVRIYTSSGISDQDWNVDYKRKQKGQDVIINDGVWIGANVFINPGIVIGENAIIGANSVVTKNVAAKSIVGGVPAKLIRFKNI